MSQEDNFSSTSLPNLVGNRRNTKKPLLPEIDPPYTPHIMIISFVLSYCDK